MTGSALRPHPANNRRQLICYALCGPDGNLIYQDLAAAEGPRRVSAQRSTHLPAQESASSGCVNAEAELHIEHLTRVEHIIGIEGPFDQTHVFDFLWVSGVVQIRLLQQADAMLSGDAASVLLH